ncbi:MAG: response regulator [Elusimicrobiales bacterium]
MEKKSTVLVVDDEEDFHIILRRILEAGGYKVVSAMSAEEGLRMLEAFIPAAVLVDWNLPGISGLDFVKHVRAAKRTRKLPVIMLTVRDDESDHLEAYTGNVDLYMTKPVVPEILLERVKSVISASGT